MDNEATLRLIPHPWERRVLPESGTVNVANIVKYRTPPNVILFIFAHMINKKQSIFNALQPDQQELFKKAFPDIKPKKKSPANELTSAIKTYVCALGCAFARVNVSGIYREQLGRHITSGSTLGYEDIDVTLPVKINGIKIGLKVAVEVKIGKDRQSKDQKLRQENVTNAGGIYLIAKTFDQFKQDFDNIRYKYEQT